jgi:hypothetical protein
VDAAGAAGCRAVVGGDFSAAALCSANVCLFITRVEGVQHVHAGSARTLLPLTRKKSFE